MHTVPYRDPTIPLVKIHEMGQIVYSIKTKCEALINVFILAPIETKLGGDSSCLYFFLQKQPIVPHAKSKSYNQ